MEAEAGCPSFTNGAQADRLKNKSKTVNRLMLDQFSQCTHLFPHFEVHLCLPVLAGQASAALEQAEMGKNGDRDSYEFYLIIGGTATCASHGGVRQFIEDPPVL